VNWYSHFGYTHHDMVKYVNQFGYKAYVSEWAHIVEYARKGEEPVAHKFIQCRSYPLGHNIAWGNLIFIPSTKIKQFEHALSEYLKHLKRKKNIEKVRSIFKKLPGIKPLYHFLRNILKTSG